MITLSILLAILTSLAISSCASKHTIDDKLYYRPSYGATAPERSKDVINPNMPYCPKELYDDTKSPTEYKNRRQYPERGMGRSDSD